MAPVTLYRDMPRLMREVSQELARMAD